MAGDIHSIDNEKDVAAQTGDQEGAAGIGLRRLQGTPRQTEGAHRALEGQAIGVAKTTETAGTLRSKIEQVKDQATDERLEYELRLSGVRNVKTAKALLAITTAT